MTAVENLLQNGLAENPEDWSVRLDLAKKFLERNATEEASALIAAGTGFPASEEQLRTALEISGGDTLSGNWNEILGHYLAENPTSALAHRTVATNWLACGNAAEAHHFYQTAIELNPALRDLSFEADLTNPPVPASPAPPSGPFVPDQTGLNAGPNPIESEAANLPHNAPQTPVPPQQELSEIDTPIETVAEEAAPEAAEPPPEEPIVERVTEEDLAEEGPSIFTLEGVAVDGVERGDDRKEKLSALTAAIVVHVALVILFALWAVAQPQPTPPQIITSALPSDPEEEMVTTKMKKYQTQPQSSAAANQMEVATSLAVSDFALPEMESKDLSFNPVGLMGDFGASMSFGSDNGGMVSFFGSKSRAERVVFVVDASASMKRAGKLGKTKFDLMKEELTRTVQTLPSGVSYQIIFFSGPAWFAGQVVDKKNWHEKDGRNYWHYKEDKDAELPSQPMLKASPSRIRTTARHIKEVKMSYGTDWRSPLKMAMNLQPDVIYFMTDGAVTQDPDKKPVVEDVLSYNKAKSKAKINCVCLMELKAFEMMNDLAKKTKGDMSIVLEDGKVLRGREVETLANKNKK